MSMVNSGLERSSRNRTKYGILPPTNDQLFSLSRLVMGEDDNGKFRRETVKIIQTSLQLMD